MLESILRRFKKLGISVDGVTDLDGPMPGESDEMIRWNSLNKCSIKKRKEIVKLEDLSPNMFNPFKKRRKITYIIRFSLRWSKNF